MALSAHNMRGSNVVIGSCCSGSGDGVVCPQNEEAMSLLQLQADDVAVGVDLTCYLRGRFVLFVVVCLFVCLFW
jgi:hypothetical protein